VNICDNQGRNDDVSKRCHFKQLKIKKLKKLSLEGAWTHDFTIPVQSFKPMSYQSESQLENDHFRIRFIPQLSNKRVNISMPIKGVDTNSQLA